MGGFWWIASVGRVSSFPGKGATFVRFASSPSTGVAFAPQPARFTSFLSLRFKEGTRGFASVFAAFSLLFLDSLLIFAGVISYAGSFGGCSLLRSKSCTFITFFGFMSSPVSIPPVFDTTPCLEHLMEYEDCVIDVQSDKK